MVTCDIVGNFAARFLQGRKTFKKNPTEPFDFRC